MIYKLVYMDLNGGRVSVSLPSFRTGRGCLSENEKWKLSDLRDDGVAMRVYIITIFTTRRKTFRSTFFCFLFLLIFK